MRSGPGREPTAGSSLGSLLRFVFLTERLLASTDVKIGRGGDGHPVAALRMRRRVVHDRKHVLKRALIAGPDCLFGKRVVRHVVKRQKLSRTSSRRPVSTTRHFDFLQS